MYAREFRDGAKDGLEALEPLDPDKITSFSELLEAMGKTAFGGRHLGKAFDVLWAMIEDPDCRVVMTLSLVEMSFKILVSNWTSKIAQWR